ncbi:hypothetical protein SAMN05216383_11931 [Prevotella sp. KH2C16]|nr:hypothetical protein SAMN05216383_11931 [Prevotella sp. KH2C16]
MRKLNAIEKFFVVLILSFLRYLVVFLALPILFSFDWLRLKVYWG